MTSSGLHDNDTVHGVILSTMMILSITIGLSTIYIGDDQNLFILIRHIILTHCAQVAPEPVGDMRPSQLFERLRCEHEEVRGNLEELAMDAGDFTMDFPVDGHDDLLKVGIYHDSAVEDVNLPTEYGALDIDHGDFPRRHLE